MKDRYNEMKVLMDNLTSSDASKNFDSSVDDMEETLRGKFIEVLGTDNPTRRDLKSPEANKMFALVEEFIGKEVQRGIEDEIMIAEFDNVPWGDEKVYTIENPELFNVSVVAKGNGDVERQRLINGKQVIETEALAVRMYMSFIDYVSGGMSWSKMVTKVANSMTQKIKERIWTTLYNIASTRSDSVYDQGTASFDADTVDTLVAHVKAANNNAPVMIIGTEQMLRNFVGTNVSDQMINDVYTTGVYQTYNGNILVPVGQIHKTGTDEFVLDDNQAIIMPRPNEKIVKVVQEGDFVIDDEDLKTYGDMSKDYLYYGQFGFGVIAAEKYGTYRITG